MLTTTTSVYGGIVRVMNEGRNGERSYLGMVPDVSDLQPASHKPSMQVHSKLIAQFCIKRPEEEVKTFVRIKWRHEDD